MNECKSFIKIKHQTRDYDGPKEEEIIINVVAISSLEPSGIIRPSYRPKTYVVRIGDHTYLINEEDYRRIIKLIEQLGGNING